MQSSYNLQLTTCCLVLIMLFMKVSAQNTNGGSIHGNFEADAQYYRPDSLIGAPNVPEKMLMNGFANFIYENNTFSAGLRY